MERLEDYLESLEQMLFSTLSAAELPNFREMLDQLWVDLTRYGPSIPEVRIPGLEFEVPAPPPALPPPQSLLDRSLAWVERNPWYTGGIITGVVGSGLLVGYGHTYIKARRHRKIKPLTTERRQVIVVLGGDTPFGHPLVLDLERKGFIVIATVSTAQAVDALESKCQGYVRALVLDPYSPDTVPIFLRSLSSTLSRKFPLTSSGDPFVSPASQPYIHSVVCLLTLAAPFNHAPFEHISLENSYLPYLNATQITPLTVIQSILPMMRIGAANGLKSIVFCLPATETRVGLPFYSVQSMSAAGTLRAIEVLRREVRVASMTGKSDFMKNLKVVVVDVGTFSIQTSPSRLNTSDVYKAMEKWTSGEKLIYGPGFAAIAHKSSLPAKTDLSSFWSVFQDSHQYGVPRKPTPMRIFVDNVVGVVSNGRFGPSIFGVGLGIGRLRNWIRGERFAIGAGAQTYKLASFLPSLILESLLSLPHWLISIRNSLLPTQPYVRPPLSESAPSQLRAIEGPPLDSDPDSDPQDLSDTNGSEADVESNSGDGATAESWISLPRDAAAITVHDEVTEA